VPGDGIVVVGLDSLLKDLRAANRALPRIVTKAIRDSTKRELLPAATRNLASQPVPKSRTKLGVSSTTRGAALTGRAPWIMGAEFGSLQYRQFRPWVGNRYTGAVGFTGYIMGKAINDRLPELERRWLDDVTEALAKEGGMR
jgi:hypothetical protein